MRKNEASWMEARQRWQIKVQKDGERKTFTSSTKGKKGKIEAERKADKWLESGFTMKSVRFSTLYDEFLEEVALLTSTSNYKNHEQIGRNWLSPRLKHKKIEAITEQMWQNCINDAYKKGRAKKTLKNIRGSITTFCKYSRKQGYDMRHPEFLYIPKDAYVKEKHILQPDDINILFKNDTIHRYGRDIPCFCIHAWRFTVLSGLRRGELCYLKHSDIKNDIVYVNGSINKLGEITQGKTENAKRWFVLSKHMKQVLQEQAEMLKKEGIISPYLFPNEDGGILDPNSLYKRWTAYRKQYDIQSNLHELRHTFISIAKADVPEELLKNIVGHAKSMDTFGIYGHSIEGEMNRAADIMDNVFDKIIVK